MATLTREAVNDILPIVLKSKEARPHFKLWQEGTGQFEAVKAAIRYWAHKVACDPDIRMTRTERIILLEFVAKYPPGPNAGKAESPKTEQLGGIRCTVAQKDEIIQAHRRAAKTTGETRSDWLLRAAMLLARIEAGEIDISGPAH